MYPWARRLRCKVSNDIIVSDLSETSRLQISGDSQKQAGELADLCNDLWHANASQVLTARPECDSVLRPAGKRAMVMRLSVLLMPAGLCRGRSISVMRFITWQKSLRHKDSVRKWEHSALIMTYRTSYSWGIKRGTFEYSSYSVNIGADSSNDIWVIRLAHKNKCVTLCALLEETEKVPKGYISSQNRKLKKEIM